MFVLNLGLRGFFRFYSSRSKMISLHANKPILYGDEASPPVRFALMTAYALGIEIGYHEINLFSGKQKTEFYRQINPLQKVPTLVVQDQVICDSHAICMYLCEQREDTTLYSSDSLSKAKINEMLFFNSGTLFPLDSAIFTDYFSGKWPVDQIKLDKLNSALDHLEYRLNKNSWLAGDEMRLCDICVMATVSSVYQLVHNNGTHKYIEKWLKNFETMPFYHINKRGLDRLLKFVKNAGNL